MGQYRKEWDKVGLSGTCPSSQRLLWWSEITSTMGGSAKVLQATSTPKHYIWQGSGLGLDKRRSKYMQYGEVESERLHFHLITLKSHLQVMFALFLHMLHFCNESLRFFRLPSCL